MQFIPAAAEGGDDPVGTNLVSESNLSSKPNSPLNQNIDTTETSILSNLESHYSSELPEYVSNQHTASNIASAEVMTESTQHQPPNSPTNNFVPTSIIIVPELNVPEQTPSEQSAPEHNASEQTTSDQNASELPEQTQPSTTIIHESEHSTNDQPSSSNLAIQPIKPTRTNVPSPPTMFLNSTILSQVCESIFQELNNLIEARNNLIHEDNYEKL